MIKAIIFLTRIALATFFALLLTSCNHSIILGDGIKGNGNITTEERSITEDFKGIDVSYGINVVVEQSEKSSVSVEADDNLQQLIVTKVVNGILKIEASKSYNSTETPKVIVKMPIINSLETGSGATISSTNALVSDNMNVKSSSGSDIDIAVEADAITLETSSGSKIKARGKALKAETSSSSGSDIDAGALMANEVISNSSSGSHTSVYPIVSLNAKASSGGSINYLKNPKTMNKEESSGGSVSEE